MDCISSVGENGGKEMIIQMFHGISNVLMDTYTFVGMFLVQVHL